MRSYAGLLIFENAFDFIPNGNPDFINLANSIFTPNVLVAEQDCGTTLGKFEVVNFEAEGLVELATEVPLSKVRIEQLLSQGIYELATRHTSTCISKGGVCASCYAATFQDKPIPQVLDRVNIFPEYLVNAEIIGVKAGLVTYTILTDPTTFTKVYAYKQGILLNSGVDFTLVDNTFTLLSTPTQEDNIIIRCIINDTAPFMVWLSNTYSGSVFGMQPLPAQALPIRSLLLSSLLVENRLQLISEYVNQVDAIPTDYAKYADQIKDPLEKGLYMLALYCIYSNVTP